MDLDDEIGTGASASSPITVAELSGISFAEELGDVRIWTMLVDSYRHGVRLQGTPEALECFEASEKRLAVAKCHEDEHGEYSLLSLDHAFNLEFRHKDPRIRAAYERYQPNPNPATADGGSQAENSMLETFGA